MDYKINFVGKFGWIFVSGKYNLVANTYKLLSVGEFCTVLHP